jgi:16S rRNA pseudouridine516 synthase
MLHKPIGVTCSHKEAGPLVYALLPERWRRREPAISTVGRLDKDTSGLLLLTDDGALLHKIISPRSNVAKRYDVTLDRPLRGDEEKIFASGELLLEGEEKPLLPARLEVLSPTRATVTVTEGRYHQVRRMFAAVGNHVTALHRDRVGSLALPDDLPAGQYRILSEHDVSLVLLTR